MKKVLILLLLLIVTCGSPEGDNLESVNQDTTSTSIKLITTTSTMPTTTTTTTTPTTTTIPLHQKVSSVNILEFNLSHPVLKDKNLREAVVCAFDRDFILGNILAYGNKEVAYNSLIPPSFIGDEGFMGIAESYDCDAEEYSDRFSYLTTLLQENFDADEWYTDIRCTYERRCEIKNLTSKSTGINISRPDVPSYALGCGPGSDPEISTIGLFLGDFSDRIGINLTFDGSYCEKVDTNYVNSDSFGRIIDKSSLCDDIKAVRISRVNVNNLYDYFNALVSKNKFCYGFNFTNVDNQEINNLLLELEQDRNNLVIAKKIEEIFISNYIIFPISTINEIIIKQLTEQISREEKGSDREYELISKLESYTESHEEFSMFIQTEY